eukprot:1158486-Pelagomonas_calceolata.AAC.4
MGAEQHELLSFKQFVQEDCPCNLSVLQYLILRRSWNGMQYRYAHLHCVWALASLASLVWAFASLKTSPSLVWALASLRTSPSLVWALASLRASPDPPCISLHACIPCLLRKACGQQQSLKPRGSCLHLSPSSQPCSDRLCIAHHTLNEAGLLGSERAELMLHPNMSSKVQVAQGA